MNVGIEIKKIRIKRIYVKYYIITLIFIIFDIEITLIYPITMLKEIRNNKNKYNNKEYY